ncbi:MAG: HAD-IIB family hydrolase [Solobacterium sp.]|nr:HAD-IIB family hydrolase [Solobacterium sp.]
MEQIKLLVLDLDGTLLNESKQISERNRRVLLQAQEEKGLRIAIGSGRDCHFAAKVAAPLELDCHRGFLICNNGQKVYDCERKEMTVIGRITNAGARIAMSYAQERQLEIKGAIDEKIFFHCCHAGKAEKGGEDANYDESAGFFTTDADFDKIVVFTSEDYTLADDHRVCEELGGLLDDRDDVTLVAPHVIDLLAKGIDKTSGIALIEERLGLKKEEILVMGDGENDLPAALKYPFSAMANSMERVKAAAGRMTLSNEEDGVAYEVERSILNR